ncbi:uncharacterized protein LOC127750308 [Frankliniella occidentalis]|uniref:Uncharacterized protein LOC127750308 n=1 Tax=Frankliniella occidentalis TaxID=133901 RepID=A0A9C6X1R1_FRAOC|nr:uncharacterized protein LOC127750308 [Frankliniella occidentalis]
MDLKEQVKASVLRYLPDLDDTDAEKVGAHIVSMKLRKIDQLKDVRVEDLSGTGPLSIFDARALVRAWQHGETGQSENNTEFQDRTENQRAQRPGVQASSQEAGPSTSTRRSSTTHRNHREWDFDINWSDLYNISPQLKDRLKKGKKLTPRMRREVIKRLVSQVRNKVKGVKRDICVQVMMDMKEKYAASFSSELAGGKIGKKTMVFKMQSHFDDVRRAKRKTPTENEAPAIKPAYGCMKWRCASPQGETQESLEEKQEALKQHFETVRPAAWDWDFIHKTMEITYGEQRKVLNKQAESLETAKKQLLAANRNKKGKKNNPPAQEQNNENIVVLTTEEIRNKWPFLFHPSCMDKHFKVLTQKELLASFTAYFTPQEAGKPSQGENVMKFLLKKEKSNTEEYNTSAKKLAKMMRRQKDVLPPHNAELVTLLRLLVRKFQEDEEALFIKIDETATEDDIPKLDEIPKTPRLFIAGSKILKYSRIYFTVDGDVAGTADTLLEGIALLFGAYFVLNLNYDANAQITLEFIQRCIVLMNPIRGNKRPPKEAGGQFNPRSIHPALKKFDTKFEDFLVEEYGTHSSATSSEEML